MPDKRLIKTVFVLCLVWLSPGTALSEEIEQPSPEMLEYLGNFGDQKGKWTDPEELEKMRLPDKRVDTEKDAKPKTR